MSDEKVLTKAIAEQFLAACLEGDEDSVTLEYSTAIEDAAAEILSRCEGTTLYLHGLRSLSDEAAESLGNHKGGRESAWGHLRLIGLTSLSDAAAENLSKHEGALDLSGLTSLSDAAAENLSKHVDAL